MADAVLSWNPERDVAAIRWGRRPNDFPLDPVNEALKKFYANSDLGPLLYLVYDGDECLGMLVAANFNPENDAEIRAVFNQVVERDGISPETDGDFARQVIPV